MKKNWISGITLLCCLTASAAGAAGLPAVKSASSPAFTAEMVSGKTMVSSAYTSGTVTFNPDGTLTCVNYPAFVTCKSWRIESDGRILRKFDDTRNGKTTEVTAWWQLLKNNGTSFDVSQTSSNSAGVTAITVTYK